MGKVGTEATLQAILAKLTNVEAYTDIIANGWSVSDWHAIDRLVKDGVAEYEFPVGSQILDTWTDTEGGTEYRAPWDVTHYYDNGDMAVNWHYALKDVVPLDEPEAIYYADANGLAAGNYYITIGTTYGTGWVAGAYISFTLTDDLVEGDQIVINCGQNNVNNPGAGRTGYVYGKGETTPKQTFTTGVTATGTSLGTIGAENIHKPNGQLNGISRVVYGYGRWSQSAMRQYLNSDAAAGSWWSPQNVWDRPPAAAATLRGWLAGCSEAFREIIVPVDVVTALNTVEGHATATETTQDKIFLPSLTEMYVNEQYAEGEAWNYYKELAAEAGRPGKFPTGQAMDEMKKYRIDSTGSAVYAWLRSCYRSYAHAEWHVYISGTVSDGGACYSFGGCPACKIRKSI